MLANIRAIRLVAGTRENQREGNAVLIVKKWLCIISLLSTVGLVGFFLEHRLLCNNLGKYRFVFLFSLIAVCPTAFSKFAFCEYVIAIANMAFHFTIIYDFPTEELAIAKGLKQSRGNSRDWKLD